MCGTGEEIKEDQRIWHYCKLRHFKSILEEKALFFIKGTEIEKDEKEGMVSDENKKIDEFIAADAFPSYPLVGRNLEKRNQCRYEIQDNILREHVFVNCWRIDDCEFTRAWCEYVGDDQGVVIQSTYDRFKECFRKMNHEVFTELYHPKKINPIDEKPPEGIFIELVKYSPFYRSNYALWYQCLLHYIQKNQKKFWWEKELRALRYDDEADKKLINGKGFTVLTLGLKGIFIPVDLEVLIEKIIVSPKIPKLHDEVQSITAEHGLEVDVCKSSLKEDCNVCVWSRWGRQIGTDGLN